MATAKKAAAKSASKSTSAVGRASSRQDRQLGTESATSRRSRAEHSEHPENAADSTVRHARPAAGGEVAGEKGFPQGEYDVNEPAKEGSSSKKAGGKARVYSVREAHLLALAAGKDVDAIRAAIKHPRANRLSSEQRAVAQELLPIGALIEHEATGRWRVRGPLGQGGPHFGFGSTLVEAIDSYILGNAVATEAEASAQRFSELSPRQQKEIRQRNDAAEKAVPGSTAGANFAIDEALKNVDATRKRLDSPINAQSDGAEVGSAVNAAGRARGTENRTRAAGRTRSRAKSGAGKK